MNSKNTEAEVISEILLKAASEPEFRKRLIKNPEKILECYSISREAKHIIRKSIKDSDTINKDLYLLISLVIQFYIE